MKILKVSGVALMASLVAGCGGGESDTGSGATIAFAAPKANSQRIYAHTTVDNSNNTIHQFVRDTVTSVNADGSYVYVHDDPNGDSFTVNGTTYSTLTEWITENNSAQRLSYSYIYAGNPMTCTVTPHGAGPDYPLFIGKAWTMNYAVKCGTALPLQYSQTGSVVGTESVSVPAGTFATVKLQSTLISTDPNGTTRTWASTTWRDVNTSIVVKQVVDIAYSGTALMNGYPVSTMTALQSQL